MKQIDPEETMEKQSQRNHPAAFGGDIIIRIIYDLCRSSIQKEKDEGRQSNRCLCFPVFRHYKSCKDTKCHWYDSNQLSMAYAWSQRVPHHIAQARQHKESVWINPLWI